MPTWSHILPMFALSIANDPAAVSHPSCARAHPRAWLRARACVRACVHREQGTEGVRGRTEARRASEGYSRGTQVVLQGVRGRTEARRASERGRTLADARLHAGGADAREHEHPRAVERAEREHDDAFAAQLRRPSGTTGKQTNKHTHKPAAESGTAAGVPSPPRAAREATSARRACGCRRRERMATWRGATGIEQAAQRAERSNAAACARWEGRSAIAAWCARWLWVSV